MRHVLKWGVILLAVGVVLFLFRVTQPHAAEMTQDEKFIQFVAVKVCEEKADRANAARAYFLTHPSMVSVAALTAMKAKTDREIHDQVFNVCMYGGSQ
jgi:hypothetical protein